MQTSASANAREISTEERERIARRAREADFSLVLSRALVGKPFAWHGRGPDAYDCWGLVRECLRRAGVRDVPDYRSCTEGAANGATMLEAMAHGWRKLPRPEFGAVVVIRMPRLHGQQHWHVGYLVSESAMLHTTEQTHGALIESLAPLWNNMIVGFYRWQPAASRIACPISY